MGPVPFAVFVGNLNDDSQDHHSKLRNRLEIETLRWAADSLCATPCVRHFTRRVICMISVNHETVSPVRSVLLSQPFPRFPS